MSVRASRLSTACPRVPGGDRPARRPARRSGPVGPRSRVARGSRLSLWLSATRCGRREASAGIRRRPSRRGASPLPFGHRSATDPLYISLRTRLGSGLGDRAVCRRGSGRRRAARGGARRKANRIFIYHYRHSSTSSGSYFFCLTHITRDSDNYTFRLSLDSVTLSSTSVVLELRFIAVLGGPRSQSQPCLAAAWPLPCSAASLLPRCRYPPRCA